jgi:hypothetical protein
MGLPRQRHVAGAGGDSHLDPPAYVEWLDRIPFHSLVSTNTAFRAAGAVLISSALIDVAIIYDMNIHGGSFGPDIVGISSLVIVVALSASIAMVGSLAPNLSASEIPQDLDPALKMDEPTAEALQALHTDTLARLDALMISKRIYRDPNLSLERMARKPQLNRAVLQQTQKLPQDRNALRQTPRQLSRIRHARRCPYTHPNKS